MAFPDGAALINDGSNTTGWSADPNHFGHGAIAAAAGVLTLSTGFNALSSWLASPTYGPAVRVCMTLVNRNGTYIWIDVRGQQPSASADTYDCYRVQKNAGNLLILRVIDKVETQLASVAQAWSDTDKMGVEVINSGGNPVINVYRYTSGAWISTPVLTYTDSNAAKITSGGVIALGGFDGNPITVDDVFAGTLTVPSNTVAPAVTGTETEGQTLSCSDGTWTENPAGAKTYQWQRDTGGGYSNIGGATSSTYVLGAGDVGATVKCLVTSTNDVGATAQASNATGTIASGPSDAAPAFSLVDDFDRGGISQGTLGADFRVDPWALGADSLAVIADEATSESGYAEEVYVVSTYTGGNGVAVKLGAAPSGTAVEAGVSLVEIPRASAAQGYRAIYRADDQTWELRKRAPGGGATFSLLGSAASAPWVEGDYVQVRRDSTAMVLELLSGADTTELVRVTDATYTGAQYASLYVYTPAGGTAASFTGLYVGGTLVEDPPVCIEDPALGGVAVEEEELTCDPGVWTGNPDFAYEWRTVASGAISGATSATFTITASEVGAVVFCRVTGTNNYGSDVADSNSVSPTAIPPDPDPDVFVCVAGEWVPTAIRVLVDGVWVA